MRIAWDYKHMSITGALFSALTLAALPGGVLAQEEVEGPQQATEDQAADRIKVTGTRIDAAEIEGTSPVTSLRREDIDASGVTTIQELLRELPAAGPGSFNTFNDSQDDTSGGTAAISLRGLGASSTLTLVNGRRVVRSATAQGITTAFVDLNSIPIAAIERIDVLKDGASPVYGTDAIAGVVNIILRDDFQGLEASGTYGISGEGDAEEASAHLTWGADHGHGNIMVAMNYFNRDLLINNDRDFARSADFSDRGGVDFRSSSGNPGTFDPGGTGFQPDPACPPERNDGTFCRFDFGPFLPIQPEEERAGISLIADYEITDSIDAFTNISIQRNNSFLSASPSPAFTVLGGFTIPASHPNNPFGEDLVRVRRRLTEFGPRQQDTDLTFFNTTFGVQGDLDLGGRQWNWEASWQFGENEVTEEGVNGFINSRLLQEAFDNGTFNPFGCETGAECTGAVVGTPSVADILDNADNPDVPPELEFLETETRRKATSHLRIWNLEANGGLFELPGGTAFGALGYQRRENDVRDKPDEQFLRGEIVGTESTFVQGEREVDAVFGEIALPVTSWAEIQAAARWEDYSDFGDTTNPKIGLLLKPTEDIRLRATYSESFRAPSLAELGNIADESPNLVDPIRCPVTGDAVDCGQQETIVRFQPTTGLDPEESEAINIGALWHITDGLTVSLDWWNIEVTDLIGTDNQFLLDQNADNPDVVVRFPPTQEDMDLGIPGRIRFVRGRRVNFGKEEVEGIDLDVGWNFDTNFGTFRWDTLWTHFITHDRLTAPGGDVVDLVGEWDEAQGLGRPQDKFTSTLNWRRNNLAAHVRTNFRSGFDESQFVTREVSSHLTVDAQVRYTWLDDHTFALSVQNLFDEDPEFVAAVAGGGFDSALDDPVGQFWTFTYTFRR